MKKLLFTMLISGLWLSSLFGAPQKVTITTSDDQPFIYTDPVVIEALRSSSVISNAIDDLGDGEESTVPLLKINAACWHTIDQCLKLQHAALHPEGEDKKGKNKELDPAIKADQDTLYAIIKNVTKSDKDTLYMLINGLNYLGISDLLNKAFDIWFDFYELSAFESDGSKYTLPKALNDIIQKKLRDRLGELLSNDSQWPMSCIKILSGQQDDLYAMCYSPDGKCIASGNIDGTIRIWDIQSGKIINTLIGHMDPVDDMLMTLCYSPDGKFIASGSSHGTINIWNAHTGNHIRALGQHPDTINSLHYYQGDGVNCICYSPDGRFIASGVRDGTICIWDVNNGNHVRTSGSHTEDVAAICYSSDGKYIVSGSNDKTIRIWDADKGALLYFMTGHSGMVNCVCCSPDGNCIASGSNDGTIRIWDAHRGKHIRTLSSHSDPVLSAWFSLDSKFIISNSYYNDAIRVRNAHNGNHIRTSSSYKPVRTASLSQDIMLKTAYSLDGNFIASGSKNGIVRIWDFMDSIRSIIDNGSNDQIKFLALAYQKKNNKESLSLDKSHITDAFDAFSRDNQLKLIKALPIQLTLYRSLMLRAYEAIKTS